MALPGQPDDSQRWGHLLLLEKVGEGGFGEVYLCWEERLDREVALKLLRHDEPESAKVLNEARLLARVRHPNVVAVYGADSIGGRLGFWMEFIHGRTLAQCLRDQGRFGPEEALLIGASVCRALAAVHGAGVLHRDIKAQNVIREIGGRIVLMDFGLGHERGAAGPDGGTPLYMAPELLKGGDASVQSDIYGIGVLLFYLVAGVFPISAASVEELCEAHQRGGARLLHDVRPDLPKDFAAVVHRALSPQPSARFATAGQMLQALESCKGASPRRRWVGAALLLAAVILVAAAAYVYFVRPSGLLPAEKHLAIFPFTAEGSDPETRAFAEGLSETLISRVSQLERFQPELWVVPSADLRKARVSTPAAAARAFHATLSLSGTVRPSPSGVTVDLLLLDAGTGRRLDSRTLESSKQALAGLHDLAWSAALELLRIRVPPEARRLLSAGGTTNPGAFEFYEKGMGYLRRGNAESLNHAIQLFELSLDQDPGYALALAGLGEAWSSLFDVTRDPADVDKAQRSARRAVALNGELTPVRLTFALVNYYTKRYPEAVEALNGILAAAPSDTTAWYWLGRTYDDMGRAPEAEAAYATIIRLRPRFWTGHEGLAYFYARHAELVKAEQQYKIEIELAPESPFTYYSLGGIYLKQGRYADARKILAEGLRLGPTSGAYSNLAYTYSREGRDSEAVPLLEKAVELNPNDHRLWRNLGDAQELSGHPQQARTAWKQGIAAARAQLAVRKDDQETLAALALLEAKSGERTAAVADAARAMGVPNPLAEILLKAAEVFELSGDRKRALDTLAAAIKAGCSREQIQNETELDGLRADARFGRLFRR